MTFDQFVLEDGTLNAIAAMGYETPTPIQQQCLAPLLEGRDVVGQARTGSGKTAAFGIPMVNALRGERQDVLGLVLVPTRELALQVTGVLADLAKASGLAVVPIYGGAGFGAQLDALKRHGAKIVVATPGRLLDHVERGTLHLDKVRMLVLDEADRMLDMGFVRDMRRVLKLVPRQRQTALFSATLEGQVRSLVGEFTTDAVAVSVDSAEATPDAEQFVSHVEKNDKQATLLHLLHQERPERAVVFTRTKHLAKRLAGRLGERGWASVALQGNMSQGQRERAMEAFREGRARILVATDVAARGLDVPGISHVVNFDLPDADQYVHRVGRTARNGARGRAFTFVQSDEHRDLRDIERTSRTRLEQVELPGDEQAPPGPDTQIVRTPPKPRPSGPGQSRRRSPQGGRPGQGGRHQGGRHQGGGRRQGGGRSQGGQRSQGGRPHRA